MKVCVQLFLSQNPRLFLNKLLKNYLQPRIIQVNIKYLIIIVREPIGYRRVSRRLSADFAYPAKVEKKVKGRKRLYK